MWKPFMNDGILYASCPDCKYDVTLEIAKKLESCPICAKLRAGVDRSYWIAYKGHIVDSPEDVYVCPVCKKEQINTDSETICGNCGARLSYEKTSTNDTDLWRGDG